MNISFPCPNAACKKTLKAPEKASGRKGQCPHCGSAFVVPVSGGAAAPAASTPDGIDEFGLSGGLPPLGGFGQPMPGGYGMPAGAPQVGFPQTQPMGMPGFPQAMPGGLPPAGSFPGAMPGMPNMGMPNAGMPNAGMPGPGMRAGQMGYAGMAAQKKKGGLPWLWIGIAGGVVVLLTGLGLVFALTGGDDPEVANANASMPGAGSGPNIFPPPDDSNAGSPMNPNPGNFDPSNPNPSSPNPGVSGGGIGNDPAAAGNNQPSNPQTPGSSGNTGNAATPGGASPGGSANPTGSTGSTPAVTSGDPFATSSGDSPASSGSQGTATSGGIPVKFEDLIDTIKPSIAMITCKVGSGSASGSGFLIDSNGWIVTNYHVVAGGYDVKVRFSTNEEVACPGYILADPTTDIAILKIPSVSSKPLKIQTNLPRQGEEVFTFGNPQGLTFRVSKGIVSANTTTKDVGSETGLGGLNHYSPDAQWIQFDAAISGGNSGGPLLNMSGEVLGLCTWTTSSGQNLNFANTAAAIERHYQTLKTSAPEPQDCTNLKPYEEPQQSVEQARELSVTLPDGRVVDFESLFPNVNAMNSNDVSAADMKIRYTSGNLGMVAGYSKGGLDGRILTLHDTKIPMLVGSCVKGKFQGNVLLQDTNGYIQMTVKFDVGQRQGFLTYWKDGKPWMIQDYVDDQLKEAHLLTGQNVNSTWKSGEEPSGGFPQAFKEVDILTKRLRVLTSRAGKWSKEYDKELRALGAAQSRNQAAYAAAERKHRDGNLNRSREIDKILGGRLLDDFDEEGLFKSSRD